MGSLAWEAIGRLHDGFRIEHMTLRVVRVPFTRSCSDDDATHAR
jgi:hypothetical protein